MFVAGTIVSAGVEGAGDAEEVPIKGFATINNVCLINIEGTGMVGVPGIASSIFATVRDAGVNVIMISQASSEHSICFAVKGRWAGWCVFVWGEGEWMSTWRSSCKCVIEHQASGRGKHGQQTSGGLS